MVFMGALMPGFGTGSQWNPFSPVVFVCTSNICIVQLTFSKVYILGGSMWPPYSTNMNKITHRQAAIDSSMPGEFKKWN